MQITQEVRDYAASHGYTKGKEALEAGMHEKADEFVSLGSEIYQPK
jgi:phosphomethylpyrimidine synthase